MNLGDITKVNEKELPEFDLLTYGFPCQDISALGTMRGLTNNGELTRSGLFFEAMRIAKHSKPKYMIAENVKMLLSKKFANQFQEMLALLNELGYNTYFKNLNSKDYGIPQSRNRVFLVSIRKDVDCGQFEFPEPIPLTVKAEEYYDNNVGQEFYLEEKHMKYLNEFRLKKKYSSVNAEVILCQTTKQGNLSNPQNFVRDEKGYRIMTPRELLVLQGFDKSDADVLLANGITKEQIGKMSGNSITVKVLEYIFANLLKVNRTGNGLDESEAM